MKLGHAAGVSSFDVNAKEPACRVGRYVQIAVTAKGDTIETGTSIQRWQKLRTCSEHFKHRGTGAQPKNVWSGAIGHIDRAALVHSDVVAKCVSSRQGNA